MIAAPHVLDAARATMRGVPAHLAQADRYYMTLALELAERAQPAPNPQVGALIVRYDRVVGFGYHERAGGPHAEVIALARGGAFASGATAYVTLEPCNHYGRTPPCVDTLLRAGIARVVYGCGDPNPSVTGCGSVRLRAAGVEVVRSQLHARATALIADWAATLATADDGAAARRSA